MGLAYRVIHCGPQNVKGIEINPYAAELARTAFEEVDPRLVGLAKAERIAVLLAGHVTKDGSVAGPRVLEVELDGAGVRRGRHHRGAPIGGGDVAPAGRIAAPRLARMAERPGSALWYGTDHRSARP